ncbi:MAG: IPTL-CTERM sorting domain-containing protein [Candidatus Competibacter sp.]|nr:IPTL-CTERM sorting domain-containing protein [Candidatus Competibacter sp.]MDG4583814.1 IPTL-CTERM sorting domain-containing protein [Candidatus Competibacter sp.]
MKLKYMRNLLVLAALTSSPAWAIFTNGGFESGDFTGWTKTIGSNPGLTGTPPFTGANVVIGAGGSDTSAVIGAGADPRAPQLVLPRAGAWTARVNDFNSGAIINSIKQSAPITAADRDPNDNKLHVRFSYAAVLEDPNHTPNAQPYFYVRLRNVTKNTLLYEDFTFANQPGKQFTTTVVNLATWLSTTNFINVDIVIPETDIGDTLEIEALGADCSFSGHGGYVYLDGFGSAVVPPGPTTADNPIPTLSEWAMILLSLALAGAVVFTQRRRNGSWL